MPAPKSPLSRRTLVLSSIALALCLGWAISTRPWGRGASPDNAPTIRFGYLPHHGYLPLFVAIENGFFAARNLNVEAVRFDSSPLLGTAFASSHLDAAAVSTSVALAQESRDPGRFRIFAVSSETRKGYLTALVSLPKSGILHVEDLRGKTLGVFPGPAAMTLFGLVLRKHGLDPRKDLVIKELPPPLQLPALLSGQVDALATYEPTATQAVLEYGAVKFLPAAVESNVLEPTQGGLWIVSSAFLKSHPKSARDLVLSIYDAIDFINRSPITARLAIAKYCKVSVAVSSQLPLIPYSKIGEVDIQALQTHENLLIADGILSKKIPVSPLFLDPKTLASH